MKQFSTGFGPWTWSTWSTENRSKRHSVIRETGKLDVTVRNSNIAKLGIWDERKTKLQDYINKRGSRLFETKAKIDSHKSEDI